MLLNHYKILRLYRMCQEKQPVALGVKSSKVVFPVECKTV